MAKQGTITNESVAKRLVELVGGKENIKTVENCMTRCRLELVDPTKADTEAIKNAEGTLGVVEAKGQLQVIYGPGKVNAFVQSNNRKRSPLKDGLPTLEDHRDLEVREAANHLFALGNESVFIGDSLPSLDELKDLSTLKEGAIELDIELKVSDSVITKLLKEVYSSRTDDARDAIRAAESRLILGNDVISPLNTINKNYGDVTIDNVDYQRYMGELQILKVSQKADKRTNVVASVLHNKLYLLKYIKSGKKFYFNIINN